MRTFSFTLILVLVTIILAACGEGATPNPNTVVTPTATPAAAASSTTTPQGTASPSPVTPSPSPTTTASPEVTSTPTTTPMATTEARPATLEVRVTDAPPEGVSSILLTVANIEVSMGTEEGESDWRTVVPGPLSFDLVAVIGVEEVLGEAVLSPGRYNQVRLDVLEATVIANGEEKKARVPGSKLRLVGGFDLVEGQTTIATLDFDAEKSVILRGAREPFLRPTVKLLVRLAGQSLSQAVEASEDVQVTPTPEPAVFPMSINDSRGKEVLLEEPVQRLVAIDSAAVEILFLMGEQDRIVATHDFVDYPPETKNIEKVGGAFALNHEKIVALNPDLVYTFFESPVEALEKLGPKVLYLNAPITLEGIADQIRLWGRIVDNVEAAEALALDYEERLSELETKIATLGEGPTVWHDLTSFYTAGKGSLIDHVYQRLGAQNIAGDIEGYPQLNPEFIVEQDPQVIITTDPDYQENILNNPALAEVSAIKSDRVIAVPGSFLSIAGPRMIDWTEELAAILYPDLFSSAPRAPDFAFTLYQGEEELRGSKLMLSDLRGKPVVLHLWGGRCPPCRADMPVVQSLYQELSNEVTFLGLDVGPFTGLGTREEARTLLEDLAITYPAGYPASDDLILNYNVVALPTTLVIDAQGRLAGKWAGILGSSNFLQDTLDDLAAG